MLRLRLSLPAENAIRNPNGNAILIESAKEGITEVLGENAARVLFVYLENHRNITLDETPYRLEAFFSTLEEIFGDHRQDNGECHHQKTLHKTSIALC